MTAPRSTPLSPQPVALLVSEHPWTAGVRELLSLGGYLVRIERSIADARRTLAHSTFQLAMVGDITVSPEIADLLTELRAACPRLIVTHQRDAACALATRLGVLVQRTRGAHC
jgi:hypothetical protein